MVVAERIEINPNVMLGKPVIRGTRIPVELILRKLSEGATEAELLDGYPRLTPEDIRRRARLCRRCDRARRNTRSRLYLLRYRRSVRGVIAREVVRLVAEQGDRLLGCFVVIRPGRTRITRPPRPL